MPWDNPDISNNGNTIREFSLQNWQLVNGTISAERFCEASAMGIKLAGRQNPHRVACAIIYKNKTYFGYSNHGKEIPVKLRGAMRQRVITTHSIGNCAEVCAMIDLVNDNPEFNVDEFGVALEVHACHTDTGMPVPPCANCMFMFLGATCASQ